MANDQAAGGVRYEHPLRDIQASVGGGVYGGHDPVARHLDAARLADDQHHSLVRARVEATIGGHFDIREALELFRFLIIREMVAGGGVEIQAQNIVRTIPMGE